jgi:hypothetical protein
VAGSEAGLGGDAVNSGKVVGVKKRLERQVNKENEEEEQHKRAGW